MTNQSRKRIIENKALGLAVISVAEKLLGLLKSLLFSFLYGTSKISDAFNVTLIIPDTLYSILANGVNSSFIPLYSAINEPEKKKRFINESITIIMLMTIAICIIMTPLAKYIVYAFAPGFDEYTWSLTTLLVTISVWSIVFSGISNILISYLQINNCFILSGFTPIILNIFQCIGIIISGCFGYYWLSIGILIGSILQFIILLILSIKNGYKISVCIPSKVIVAQIFVFALPIVLSSSANRINLLIDRAMASSIMEGGVSALAYADSLVLFMKCIFGIPFITMVFPLLTIAVNQNDKNQLSKLINESIEKILFYIVPITFGCVFIASEIVSIVFQRGAFTQQSVEITSNCLIWYACGLPAFCIRDLFVKVFYAKQDSKTPTINMFIGVAINIALNFTLTYFFGLKGLAMASSASAYIILFLLYICLLRTKTYRISKTLSIKLIKISISSSCMLLSLFVVKYYIINNMTLIPFVCIITSTGFLAYCIFLYLFKTYSLKTLCEHILMK